LALSLEYLSYTTKILFQISQATYNFIQLSNIHARLGQIISA